MSSSVVTSKSLPNITASLNKSSLSHICPSAPTAKPLSAVNFGSGSYNLSTSSRFISSSTFSSSSVDTVSSSPSPVSTLTSTLTSFSSSPDDFIFLIISFWSSSSISAVLVADITEFIANFSKSKSGSPFSSVYFLSDVPNLPDNCCMNFSGSVSSSASTPASNGVSSNGLSSDLGPSSLPKLKSISSSPDGSEIGSSETSKGDALGAATFSLYLTSSSILYPSSSSENRPVDIPSNLVSVRLFFLMYLIKLLSQIQLMYLIIQLLYQIQQQYLPSHQWL